jgi:hypothetical protein
MAHLDKENSLQKEAFEIYYLLGDKRSLKAVASKIGRTERTVAGWSRQFNWVDRVSQREIEERKNSDSTTTILAQTIDIKTRYRIMVNNLMAQASRKIARGELSIKNVQDFERVVKLDLLLMGEPTERQDGTVTGSTELSQADKDRLDMIAKLLAGK